MRDFVDARSFIGKTVTVRVDRPLGSKHPEAGFIYPVNYGFLPDVPAPDGEDMDAYVLGVFKPLQTFTGHCVAVIQRADDSDDKVIVVPEGKSFTDDQILALTEFQERFFQPSVTREAIPSVE